MTDAGQFRRVVDMSDAELLAIVTGAQPAPSAPVEPEAEQPTLGPKKAKLRLSHVLLAGGAIGTHSLRRCPLWGDCVAKVVLYRRSKILRVVGSVLV
jgi:hypothetical protein